MNNTLTYRSWLRKKIAEIKVFGLNSASIKKIAELKDKLNAPSDRLIMDLSMGKLINVLGNILQEEEDEFKTQAPSQTDKERWALEWAVLEYYKNLGVPYDTQIIDNPSSGKTIHQYAPDTEKVYVLWLNKLKDLTKEDGQNNFSLNKYDEDFDRGISRGGAFEKQLQRFREKFVNRMLTT